MKHMGDKTGDTFDSLFFLFTFLSLGFLVPVSSIRDAVNAIRTGFNAQLSFFFTLEFCSDFHLEAQGLPLATPQSKPTLNCSKQEGGDRCFLTCQSQVHISSGE